MPPKRRRRFQGLYYHSSPPKVLPMNDQLPNQNGRRRRDVDEFSIKLSTIRIWMHEKDIGKLTRILWAGQGNRLRQQASTNPRVKRFLAAVPYVMNDIKDVHQAVIDNNLETLQSKLEPPVPSTLITGKDANGLNVVHKAAGLGHTKILEYLISIWPEGVNETDITGKTPLHWAASAKNNMRCYTILTQAGCDEEAVDYKSKTPSYYRHKPNEIERAFLVYVPDAPRVSPDILTDWDALSEDPHSDKKSDTRMPLTNGNHERTNDDSMNDENTSEMDLNDGVSANEENEMPKNDDDDANGNDTENGNTTAPGTPVDEDKTSSENDKPEDDEKNAIETNEVNGNNDDIEENENSDNGTDGDNGENVVVEAKDEKVEGVEVVKAENSNDGVENGNGPDEEEKEGNNETEEDQIENAEEQNEEDNYEEEQELIGSEEKEKESQQDDLENVGKSEEDNASESDKPGDNATNDAAEGEVNDSPEEVNDSPEEVKDSPEDLGDESNENIEEKEKTEYENAVVDERNSDNGNEIPENNVNDEVVLNGNENDLPDHLLSEYEKRKANKVIEQDQETGEKTCVPKSTENESIENQEDDDDQNVEKDDNDENDNDDETDEAVVAPVGSAKSKEENGDEDEDEDAVVSGDGNNEIDNPDNDPEPEPEDEPDEEENNDEDINDIQANDKLDENHNDGSLTSSLAIEGFVEGVSEDNTVQSQSAALIDEETRVQDIIASGDMEQLAQIVLNGDGNKLLNMQSSETDIQAFLTNVPNYMNKIRRVHEAAREGSLLSLQQALDRRKFAIAKDEISPNGATPLHVAVLFGHSDIVRYLAARFPETTTITDSDGRTPLHYAAVIKDNGHFYNMLMQLGANPKTNDKLGHSPEYYLDEEGSGDILTYRQLLSNFGAEDLEAELLSDQVPDDAHSSRRQLQDGDTQQTLDRCFTLIQESGKALSGITATAVTHRKSLSPSSLQLSVTSYLSRFLKGSVYEKIKRRQTRLDHNLFDVIWPAMRKASKVRHLEEDINCGTIAPDFDVFVVFQEFLVPLIKDMHCMSITTDFKPHPRIAYFPMENGERLNTAGFVFDDDSRLVQRCYVETSRNLEEFELPLNLTIGQIEQVERMVMGKIFTSSFAEAIGEKESGNYYTLTEILEENSEVMDQLTSYGLMIQLLDTKDTVQAAESLAFNGSLWPYGRGVYVNSDSNLALWINCQEHLRIISTTNASDPADLGAAYTRVGRAVSYLESQLHFKESYLLGYLQARPSYLGTGLKMTTLLRLPNLMKEMDNLRHLCSVRGLCLITNPLSRLTVRLVNMKSLGEFEYVLFQDYCTAITNILSLEKDMSLSNSKHIATMLVKIFRREAESHSFQSNPIFKTEQGKYLANTLAEPLIEALTEIANKRPDDPISYLTGYLQSYMRTRNPKTDVPSSSSKTSSTAIVNSNTPVTRRMNGNLRNAVTTNDEIEPDESEEIATPQSEDRDEHGQSMLHFACARSHRRGGLLNLIEESNIDITYRDELYRTARDVSLQANQPANAKEIDRYILSLAVVGDLKPFEHFALSGYDHIIDVTDDNDKGVIDVAAERGHEELADFLRNLRPLEELREELHQMIRDNNVERVKEIVSSSDGKWLLKAKNYYGRTALHIAVLKESEEIVEHFVDQHPEIIKIGDNLERTPLHYAMGTNAIESLSRILITKGAKRTTKDLKGRQPSYYFMNKADVLRLQEEEDENR